MVSFFSGQTTTLLLLLHTNTTVATHTYACFVQIRALCAQALWIVAQSLDPYFVQCKSADCTSPCQHNITYKYSILYKYEHVVCYRPICNPRPYIKQAGPICSGWVSFKSSPSMQTVRIILCYPTSDCYQVLCHDITCMDLTKPS